jgi:hypothetical protein
MFERVRRTESPLVATDRNVGEYDSIYFLAVGRTLAISPNVVAGMPLVIEFLSSRDAYQGGGSQVCP